MKMLYVSTATWEGVSGFLEKIKRTCRGVTGVMVCCDSDGERMPCFRKTRRTVLIYSEYVADCIVCTCLLSAPQTYLLPLLLFFAELILQTAFKIPFEVI